MKKESKFTEEQLEFITDTTCKYGHLCGCNKDGYLECVDCHTVLEKFTGGLISQI